MPKRKTERDGSLSGYAHAIQRHPLLSADEEVALGKRIRRKQKGVKTVREELVQANLRLVISVAAKYVHATKSLSLTDLIQEGSIGLMKAVKKWDHRRGFRFSSYAAQWIHREVQHAIASTDQTVHVPTHLHELVRRYKKVSQEHWSLEEKPAFDQIVYEMELTQGEIDRLRDALHIEWVSSLDEIRVDDHGETGSPLLERITYPDVLSLEEESERRSRSEKLQVVIKRLPKRERKILTLHLKEATLRKIGKKKEFGFCAERVRQLTARAIKKVSKSLAEEVADD